VLGVALWRTGKSCGKRYGRGGLVEGQAVDGKGIAVFEYAGELWAEKGSCSGKRASFRTGIGWFSIGCLRLLQIETAPELGHDVVVPRGTGFQIGL